MRLRQEFYSPLLFHDVYGIFPLDHVFLMEFFYKRLTRQKNTQLINQVYMHVKRINICIYKFLRLDIETNFFRV